MILGPGRRAVRARPDDEVGLPDRPPDDRRRRRSSREGTNAAGGDRGGPEVARHRRARDLLIVDDKNVALALAPGRRRRAPGRRRRSGSRTTAAGATTSVAIGTFLRDASAGLYNLYVVDPSEQQILVYYAGQRRQRLPGRPDRPPRRRPRRLEGRRAVHRRRHLRRRRRRHRPVRRRPERGLGAGRRAARRHAPPRAARTTRCSRRRATSGPAASTPGTSRTAGRRVRQGQGHVHRAVPPRRRQPGLGGRPRDVRRPRPAEDAPPTLVWATNDGRHLGGPRGRPRRRRRPRRCARRSSGSPSAARPRAHAVASPPGLAPLP